MPDRISDRFAYPRTPGVSFGGEEAVSKTQQHFAKDADVNVIVARAKKTGFLVDPLAPRNAKPQYGNFTVVPDYHEMQSRIAAVNSEFMSLPAVLRARFRNSPEVLIEWLADPANAVEAVKLGLLPESAAPKPAEVLDVVPKDKGGATAPVVPAGSAGPAGAGTAGAPAAKS